MIRLANVKSGYEGNDWLSVDTLAFERGQLTTIVGKNGSGESSLLRTVCSLLPYKGSILLDEAELSTLKHRERAKKVAYLPQLFPAAPLRVSALVSHGRFARAPYAHAPGEQDQKAVLNAMELAEVSSLADRRVDTLSGGERALVYLAMIIAQDSDYMLLDEPASDMDISHQQLLNDIFRKLTARGKGIIVSSHDLPLSFSVSDRICLMSGGIIKAVCTPEELILETSLLRKCVGATLAPTHDPDALYKYMLAK